jgi:hypothetical protein
VPTFGHAVLRAVDPVRVADRLLATLESFADADARWSRNDPMLDVRLPA